MFVDYLAPTKSAIEPGVDYMSSYLLRSRQWFKAIINGTDEHKLYTDPEATSGEEITHTTQMTTVVPK